MKPPDIEDVYEAEVEVINPEPKERFVERPGGPHFVKLPGQPVRLLEGELLPPASGPVPTAVVVQRPAQALTQAVPQAPAVDPVTAYLSRYTSQNSRLAMESSLTVCARLLTGRKDITPREVPWHEVRYAHAQTLRAKLASEYAWASANRHLLALRGIVKECWRLGLVEHDVYARVADVGSLKSDKKEHGRALTAQEVTKLYAACDRGTSLGLRDAAVLALTVGAGLRRSEVCGLQLVNWKGAESRLEVLGKGNVWRSAHLSPRSSQVIEDWLARRGREPGPLVCKVDSHDNVALKPLVPSGLYSALQELGGRAGVEDFTPHDLRRTFITRLLEKGADVLTVSKLVGHQSVETTKRYDKRGDESKRAAVALLDDDEVG